MDNVEIRTDNNAFIITYQSIAIHIKIAKNSKQVVGRPCAFSRKAIDRTLEALPRDQPLPTMESFVTTPRPLSEFEVFVLLYIRDQSGLISEAYINDQRGNIVVESFEVPLSQTPLKFTIAPKDNEELEMDFKFNGNSKTKDAETDGDKGNDLDTGEQLA